MQQGGGWWSHVLVSLFCFDGEGINGSKYIYICKNNTVVAGVPMLCFQITKRNGLRGGEQAIIYSTGRLGPPKSISKPTIALQATQCFPCSN